MSAPTPPCSVAEVEGFIDLLMAASNEARKGRVHAWVTDLIGA